MAYTRQWPSPPPEPEPADTELANQIGRFIREFRADIRERMDDVFTDPSGTWAASGPSSPLVPSAALKGNVTSKTISIHHSAFRNPLIDMPTFFGAFNNRYLEDVSTVGPVSATLYAPLVLPLGVTVKALSILASRSAADAGSITVSIGKLPFDSTDVQTVVGTVTANSGSGLQVYTTSGLTIVPTSTDLFALSLVYATAGNRNIKFYGVQLVYDTPDSRNTL